MVLGSLIKLNNSISVRNFAPEFRCRLKEKQIRLRRIPVQSQSVILDFLLPSGYYLPKTRGPDIFRPLQCQTRRDATPSPNRNRRQCFTFC